MKLKSSRAKRLLKTLSKELRDSAVRRLEACYNDRYGKTIVLSSIQKKNLMQATYWSIFFFSWKYATQEKIALESNLKHRPWALAEMVLKRYFLERKDGESFDIGEDKYFKKKLAAKKKQLKAEGKRNRPHRAVQLDENQMEKLWTTGAVGLKTPHQLLHLLWWNDNRILGMRGDKNTLTVKSKTSKTKETSMSTLSARRKRERGKRMTQKQDASTTTRYQFEETAMKEILILR